MNANSYGQERSNVRDFVGQPTWGGLPAWGMDEVLTTPHRKKNYHVTKEEALDRTMWEESFWKRLWTCRLTNY